MQKLFSYDEGFHVFEFIYIKRSKINILKDVLLMRFQQKIREEGRHYETLQAYMSKVSHIYFFTIHDCDVRKLDRKCRERNMTFQTTSSNKCIIKNDSLHSILLPTDK